MSGESFVGNQVNPGHSSAGADIPGKSINPEESLGNISEKFTEENAAIFVLKKSENFPKASSSSSATIVTTAQMSSSSMESSASNNSSPVHQQHFYPTSYENRGKSLENSATPTTTTSSTFAPVAAAVAAVATTQELIANKQRFLQKENLRRVMNPPKLERKHSSGDLHSRLKTRKILGVGETDNGDIHRSKISQVLGHNEHLYVKFPRGVWSWQAFLSALLLVQALLILFFPRQACQLKLLGIQQHQKDKEGLMMGSKYYAVSLLALSFLLWRFMFIRDKNVARTVQLTALLHFFSLCIMDLINAATNDISQLFDATLLTVMGVRLGTVFICSIYVNRIGKATSGLRKSPSHKDLRESLKKDG